MAEEAGQLIRATKVASCTKYAKHHGSKFAPDTLQVFGAQFVEAVLRGEVGPSTVKGLARQFEVRDALIRVVLEQADELDQLDFITAAVVRVQVRELIRDIFFDGGPGVLIYVRTQPTSPLKGTRKTYRGKEIFGLSAERNTTTMDTNFATVYEGGHEQSVALGGYAPGLEKDRVILDDENERVDYLSAVQILGLTEPTNAMFRHAGAVRKVADLELPAGLKAPPHIFLQGRFEGPEESYYLSSPVHTVSIVGEPNYQLNARQSLGDEVDLLVEAEGSTPHDRGLERRHVYIDSQGEAIPNRVVREMVDKGLPYKLDRYLSVEHHELELILMPGELRAPLPGDRHEGGQGLLLVSEDGPPRWFSLLNRADGRRAWDVDPVETRRRLQRLVEALAMLEAPGSTAGETRRQQYETFEAINIPLSHACAREKIWRLAAAFRQGGFPDAPLGALPVG